MKKFINKIFFFKKNKDFDKKIIKYKKLFREKIKF